MPFPAEFECGYSLNQYAILPEKYSFPDVGVCIHLCVYVCGSKCMCLCVCVHSCVHACLRVFKCVWVRVHVCECV